MRGITILVGDRRETLRRLPDAAATCCVTSPPHFGRRKYLPEGHPDGAPEIGRGATLDASVSKLVSVFAEARRVLSPRESLWLNLGDAYAQRAGEFMGCPIKPKDLLMLLARAA